MKSYHVAAYVHKAEFRCCDCVAEWAETELINEGFTESDVNLMVRNIGLGYDVGVYGYRSEILLRQLAKIWRINVEDEYSYDSDDFPKVVFVDQIEDDEYCGVCLEKIL